jgi:medium-chain acyl-[acyl-carrier-protein] hydrolase
MHRWLRSCYPTSMLDAQNPTHTFSGTADGISRWFPALKPRPKASLRLICFPYAGAGTAVFRAWPGALNDTIELRVAQLPGRGGRLREDRFERMPPLIETLVENLRPLLDRPFAFFGHSLGAIVAFETARVLRGCSLAPAHLFVSGKIAPQLPDPAPRIHELPDSEFLRELQKLNGMPQAVLDSKELLEIMLPVVRSDFSLLESYTYEAQAPLGCPITAFGGLQDPRTTEKGLGSWRAETTDSFDLVMLQGDHFFLDTARPVLLQSISRSLLGMNSGLAGSKDSS